MAGSTNELWDLWYNDTKLYTKIDLKPIYGRINKRTVGSVV